MKTIDVQFKEWFDKVNGNSYCAGTVTIDYGMKSEKVIHVPFEYGYGDFYMQRAMEVLVSGKYIKPSTNYQGLYSYTKEHGIILRNSITRGCKKRELTSIKGGSIK